MKTTKRLIALVLVTMLILALGTTALADGPTGEITITNASAGQDYKLYKLFDVTYNSSTKTSAYSTDNATFASALTASNLFTVTGSDGKYNVSMTKDNATAALAWFKENAKTYGKLIDTKRIEKGNKIVFTAPYGYYYITSGLGAALTINQNTPTVEVIDKNETKPNIPEGGKAKTSVSKTAAIGDNVTFTVKFTATNYVTDNSTSADAPTTNKVLKYTITDTPTGFTLPTEDNSVNVTIGTNSSTTKFVDGVITLPWVNNDNASLYVSPIDVTVTYNAKMNKDALSGNKANNKAKIDYYTDDAPTTPKTVNPDDPGADVHNFTISILKVDKDNETRKLSGAEFVLRNSDTKYLKIDVTSKEISWVASKDSASKFVTADNGTVTIDGIKSGTYSLEETKAPQGYNPLLAPISITLAEDATVFVDNQTVLNSTGTILPETGGQGTTILLAVGAAIFVATAVILVTKKRMYNES